MKIAFFAGNCVPIHARTLDERPLGGTETGVIRLAEALQKLNHDVTIFTTHKEPPQFPGAPKYLPLEAVENHPPVDLFIAIRDWIPTLYKIEATKKMLWTGDSYDSFPNFGLGDKRVASNIHALLTVSTWHADTLAGASGFPREKCFVLGNGIEPSYFEGSEKKERKRLIYSSTPHRGLAFAGALFTELRKKHTDAEFHVFSSYQVYFPERDTERPPFFNELERTPGVVMHGSAKQKDLAREFMKSSILFYPCDFEETCCITALEAQAAGCAVVSTQLAALPETVGKAGILVPGRPSTSANYARDFLNACDKLLSDDAAFEAATTWGREHVKEYSWLRVAERFDRFLKSSASKNTAYLNPVETSSIQQ